MIEMDVLMIEMDAPKARPYENVLSLNTQTKTIFPLHDNLVITIMLFVVNLIIKTLYTIFKQTCRIEKRIDFVYKDILL